MELIKKLKKYITPQGKNSLMYLCFFCLFSILLAFSIFSYIYPKSFAPVFSFSVYLIMSVLCLRDFIITNKQDKKNLHTYKDELNRIKEIEKPIEDAFENGNFFIKNTTKLVVEIVVKIKSSILFYRKDELGEVVYQSFPDGKTKTLDQSFAIWIINKINSEMLKITQSNIKKNREKSVDEISSLLKNISEENETKFLNNSVTNHNKKSD